MKMDHELTRLGYSWDAIVYMGDGAKRAALREAKHADKQAARVAPALAVLAEKRKTWAAHRFARWTRNVDMECDVPGSVKAPGHIRAMSIEALR